MSASLFRLACVALLMVALPARAAFHLWVIDEIFSNADGTVQFIELKTSAGFQQFLNGVSITASQGATTHSFTFPADLPGDTTNKRFLIGTTSFAALGLVTPDYIVPDNFLFLTGGSLNFAGVDTWSYGTLPTDGVTSRNRDGTTGVRSPTNFAGATAPPPPAPSTTTMISSVTSPSPPTSITFTATVTGGSGTPTGNVVFRDGVADLGTIALNGSAQAAFTTSALAVGSHSITANFQGNGTYSPSASTAFPLTIENPPPNPPRLANISTRMQVLTGNDVMIGGFVIGGAASKQVAIVATGPSLTQYGITNALANPTLTLVRSSDQAVLATNDDWQSAGNAAQLQTAGFAPSNALESAILTTLAPGAYTAIVSGVSDGTGVGVVAVYEVDHPEIPLINISTRGQVLTGNDVMIGGFIIQGSGSQQVAIVATGPSLSQFGIVNPLANPTLTLVRSSDQAVLATNDDWQSAANAAAIQSSGFAPSNTLESAILTTLAPGAYTAILSGVSGGTGVGVIGVYTVP